MKAWALALLAVVIVATSAGAIHMSESRAKACGEHGCHTCGENKWAVGVGAKAHGYWETYKCVDARKFKRRP